MPPPPPRGPNKCKAVPHLDLQLKPCTSFRRLKRTSLSLWTFLIYNGFCWRNQALTNPTENRPLDFM